MQILNASEISRRILLPKLAVAGCIVDATAGNGHDTLFLARYSPKNAQIYAFDVQEKALSQTRRLLAEHALQEKVSLILAGHEALEEFVKETIHIAVFNLGYLPGANHAVTTRTDTTLQAVKAVLEKLAAGGILSIMLYPGHEEGAKEQKFLTTYFTGLSKRQFTSICCTMTNHAVTAPQLYLIEKVRG